MFSLACVLDSVGYDRLDREPFLDSNEPTREALRSISGTIPFLGVFGVCDVVDVVRLRMRSFDVRSLGRSPSRSPAEIVDPPAVLRVDFDDLPLLCLSFFSSRSLSLLLVLLRSRSGVLRRRPSEGLNISAARNGETRWCYCDQADAARRLRRERPWMVVDLVPVRQESGMIGP